MSKCAGLFVGLLAHNENRRIGQSSWIYCSDHERKGRNKSGLRKVAQITKWNR